MRKVWLLSGVDCARKLSAVYPGMPPRVHPRGPQEQIGWEQVPELLLGGRGATLAQTGVVQGFGFATAGSQAALAVGAAASAAGPVAPTQPPPTPRQGAYVSGASGSGAACTAIAVQPGGPDQAGGAADSAQASAAAVEPARQCDGAIISLSWILTGTSFLWCCWNSTLYNNAIWTHWRQSWWRLRGPDPVFHPYSNEH